MTIRWFGERVALEAAVQKAVRPASIILDVGCGIYPQDYIVPAVHICCEPFPQYVEHLQERLRTSTERRFVDRHYIVIQATWRDALALFPARSVDTVFGLDFIEHVEKEQGQCFLAEASRVARSQIVLFTPLGFVPQERDSNGKDAWGLDGADWQEHRSGWEPRDFDASWEIFAHERFHETNNLNQPVDPFGAFFAIRTLKPAPLHSALSQTLHGWVDRALETRAGRALDGVVRGVLRTSPS